MSCPHCENDLIEAPPRTGGIVAWLIGGGLIFVIVIALLIPAKQGKGITPRMTCSLNEKQIVLALHAFHEVHDALPPLYTVDDKGKPLHSWRVLILPHVEQQELYKQIRLDEPWDSEYNRQFHDQMPHYYQCPSNPKKGCCYSAIAGGSFIPAKEPGSILGLKFEDFTKPKWDTLAIVEVKEPFCWMDPTADVTLEDFVQRNRVGSYHKGGMYGSYVDSSVRFITETVSSDELRAMAMPGV
jgi:hypothetical protein